eukprot:TRINITY_DN10542_c0_g2_i4.p3 TRINITY_DN10542_c0_g2~~TRINITY_DN10542_c0_g2_i4.p3  ORF type:complete len:141 (+),score=13.27 TRINITY_DN10542_c0_g2_i4:641-1063(+)
MDVNKKDWFSQPCIMGIDEAGRGPVLGPMVYAVAYCPLDFEEQLKNLEFADSKQLTEYHRDKLFQKIKEEPKIGYEHDVIHAETISYKMLSWEQVSLNVLANESTYALIEKVLQKGVNIKKGTTVINEYYYNLGLLRSVS